MNLFSPTTVTGAAGILSGPKQLGLKWPDQRKQMIQAINRIRAYLYSISPTMFGDVFHCFVPQTFRENCLGTTCRRYLGITLPPDMESVVEAWECRTPLTIRSRWRETFTGRLNCDRKLSVELMPQRFPVERDLPAYGPVNFYAESPDDDGKILYIEYRDRRNHLQKFGITIRGDNTVTTPHSMMELVSVVLPTGLCGKIVVSQGDYWLSEYAPWQDVPNYARVKILSPCSYNIFIQGSRKFTPVWWDHDIVECGDTTVLEFMATYVKHIHSGDPNDRKMALEAAGMAEQQITRLNMRQIGGAFQDGLKHKTKPSTPLPGYARRKGLFR